MSQPPPSLLHDVFTHLCDCALHRPVRRWRWQNPDGYRLRFLRQLTSAAGLLDTAACPTPLAHDWLHQPPTEQRAILADAWAHQADTVAREASLHWLTQLPPGTSVSFAQLSARRSADRQRRLWQPLVWLDYLTPASPPATIQILTLPDPPAAFPAWDITPTEIYVHPPYQWADLWDLEHIAALQDPGPPRRYALSPAHWQRARARGFSTATALTLLERASGEPLPVAVWEHFSPAAPAVTLQTTVLVTFSDATQLAQLTTQPAWARRLAHILSPRHVRVSPAQAPLIIRALNRHGLTVHAEPFPPSTAPGLATSNTDLLHLLLAARVLQALARELDLPDPLDEATLTAIAHRLPASHQRRLDRSQQRQLAHIRQQLPEPRAVPPPPRPRPETTAIVHAAVVAGQALQLHYQPPAPRPLLTRPVAPLRLEAWGAHTYLLAECLHRGDLRTFRLDRIIHAEPLTR